MGEAIEVDTIVHGSGKGTRATGKAGRSVFYFKIVDTRGCPTDSGCGAGDGRYRHIVGTNTGGNIVNLNIVEIDHIGGASDGKGNVFGRRVGSREGNFKVFPHADGRRRNGGNLAEGGVIVRVGHGTHRDAVVGARLVERKGNLE